MTDNLLTLRLRRMTWEAEGVLSLDLCAPDGGDLPAFSAGAHVDLHLPGGQSRQYSLCGDPADRKTYRLGIRLVEGGAVTSMVHRQLRPGALLDVSTPRNNFPLLPAPHYLFIAGGIGITPMLPMLREANARGAKWTLLFCVRRHEDAPFLAEARSLGGDVVLHASALGTRLDVEARLATVEPDTQIYCCGPEKLMLEVETHSRHWPDGSVHFEWFAARSRPEDEISGGFELVCARSRLTLTVPPDKSVVQVLHDAGIQVPLSCEQGICGSCECRVLEGQVDHRDSILSTAEQLANETMMVCVSRAKSPRLVLDL
ncbi:MAG: PDR/VanB family oxidoreductase [Acetobacteraceae bacterium]|nr:PDR/VanB family oxidoreductase [Acetobacteraceae bacterium]